MKIVIGIVVAFVYLCCFALAKSAGMADQQLEEMQRLSAGREAGGTNGN